MTGIGGGWQDDSVAGGITGAGTINTYTKFTGATVIGDGFISDNGVDTVSVGANLNVIGKLTVTGIIDPTQIQFSGVGAPDATKYEIGFVGTELYFNTPTGSSMVWKINGVSTMFMTSAGYLELNGDPIDPMGAATKQYADNLVVGLLDDRGGYDASTNLFPSPPVPGLGGSGPGGSILKGDLWYITDPGTLGGTPVLVGYSIRALVDNPGQTPDNWGILHVGLGYVPENVANKATTFGVINNTLYPSVEAVSNYVTGQGYISAVTGTVNRITVTAGTIIDISVNYAGQSSITTVGTITAGTWNGNIISPLHGGTGIANNAASTITISGNFASTFIVSGAFNYTMPSATSTLLANNLGIAGGTTLIGGTAASETLTLVSTSHATKGKILFGTSAYDEVNNRLGIGINTPTAFIDAIASLTTQASFRLRPGIAPLAANQNNGDIWNDSTQNALSVNLYGASSAVLNIETVLFTQTATGSVGNTTVETTILNTGVGTTTLPANFLTIGKTIRLIATGTLTRGAGNLTFRFKIGGVTFATNAAANPGNSTNGMFKIEIYMTCRTVGNAGSVFTQGMFTSADGNTHISLDNVSVNSINTTISNVIDLTYQQSALSGPNNIQCTNLTIEVLN